MTSKRKKYLKSTQEPYYFTTSITYPVMLTSFNLLQYDGDEYPTYDYNTEYDGAPAPTQQTDYGQYYDYDYDGTSR